MRILLIPFFNAKSKYVNVYKNMYKKMYKKSKIDVVNYSLFNAINFTGWNRIKDGCYNKYLNYNSYDLIHTFSGGNFVLHNLINNNNSLILNSNKIIFDSSPFFATSKQTSKYICNTLNINNNFIDSNLQSLISTYWSLEKYDKEYEVDMYNNWLNATRNSLCLLPENDPLLEYKDIELWSDKTNSEIVYFNDSNHVQLYRKHPEKYMQNIIDYYNKK